jgi:hypothetical protein
MGAAAASYEPLRTPAYDPLVPAFCVGHLAPVARLAPVLGGGSFDTPFLPSGGHHFVEGYTPRRRSQRRPPTPLRVRATAESWRVLPFAADSATEIAATRLTRTPTCSGP